MADFIWNDVRPRNAFLQKIHSTKIGHNKKTHNRMNVVDEGGIRLGFGKK
jgi:hypothetical protein